MQSNVVGAIDRIRPQAGIPLIVCDCPSPTPQDGTAWLWVFHEDAPNRLQQRWAGVLTHPETDELVSRLRQQTYGRDSIWRPSDARESPRSSALDLASGSGGGGGKRTLQR